MSPSNSLLLTRIKRHFSNTIFSRGADLFREGHVGDIDRYEIDNGFYEYEAWVLGSSGNDYQTSIIFFENSMLSECDCPYSVNCKHGAALALAVAETMSDEDDAGDQGNLEVWLNTLKTKRVNSQASVSMTTAQQDWHAFYLIDTTNARQPILVPVMRYRKKTGEWGRLDQLAPYKLNQFKGQNAQDKAAWSLMASLPTRHHSLSSHQFMQGYLLQGAVGFLLLQHALHSGRALDIHSMQPVQANEPRHLHWQWMAVKGGKVLAPQLAADAEGKSQDWQYLHTTPPAYRTVNSIGKIETPLDHETLAHLLNMPVIPKKQFEQVCIQLAHWVDGNVIPLPEGMAPLVSVTDFVPKATLLGVYSAAHGYLPALRLTAVYGDWEKVLEYPAVDDSRDLPDQDELIELQGRPIKVTRRFGREYELTQSLRALELTPYNFEHAGGELWVPAEINPQKHLTVWHKNLRALQDLFEAQAWQVDIDDSYQTQASRANLSGEASNHQLGWFDLSLAIEIGGGIDLDTASLMSQWLAAGTPPVLPLKNKEKHWTMVDMSPLQPMLSILLELHGAGNLNKSARLPAFKVLELGDGNSNPIKQSSSLKKLRQTLRNFTGLDEVAPDKKLQADMRDYQVRGLSWLMFLRTYGFGGILADDMGLGKTLQTLAFIQKLKATRKLTKGALVVAPTSLIWNWLSEAQKFTPNLKCLMLHGTERKARFDEIPGHDLVVTSYGLIQRDIEVYQAYHFDLVILDEAQNIKNTQAKTTAMVKQLSADMRLCLTGTPLENHLGELWSLTDFSLPGLLGSKDYFRRHFRQEIEQQGNSDRGRELSTRVAPFMLRRTKGEVVHELPQKTEILQTVDLAKDQKALYESIRVSMEKRVRDLIKQKGVARSHIEFLDALLKLRQACIDPRLVKLNLAKKITSSAKMQWLIDTVPELVEEGRKILIFSQFTQMLDLIDDELKQLRVPTIKLTGRTRDRQKIVQEFQQGNTPVFLISLKAGGSGLNLTAADTVIHVDPWWNPAVENQATDRAYRIGQDKPVFVYKLVANGTVEEKIQAMQKQKQKLADTLFDATGKKGLPKTGDELLALFER